MPNSEPAVDTPRETRRPKAPLPTDMLPQSHSGRWGTLIALVALLFSGVSLYQTVLKQPMPTVYPSKTLLFGHDASGHEVFALPLTVVNHGPRDAVVTSLTLTMTNRDATGRATYTSRFFGDTPRPTERSFTPIFIAGHSSFAGSVIFTRSDEKANASLNRKDIYSFCVSIRTETGDTVGFLGRLFAFYPTSLNFAAEVLYLDRTQLAAGQYMSLDIVDIKRVSHACD